MHYDDMNEMEMKETEEAAEECDESTELTAAQQAAEYLRSFGLDTTADYALRHYDGTDFDPEEPIRLHTINEKYEGSELMGIPFERREYALTENDEVRIEAVFPEWPSDYRYEYETIHERTELTPVQQAKLALQHFQDHMFDSPEMLAPFTLEQMEALDNPNAVAPLDYECEHHIDAVEWVPEAYHQKVRHTGARSMVSSRYAQQDA